MPLDTLDTPNPKAKLIIYTNNTWSYYFPDYEALASQEVYNDHWVTNQVFAYRDVSISDIPESCVLWSRLPTTIHPYWGVSPRVTVLVARVCTKVLM